MEKGTGGPAFPVTFEGGSNNGDAPFFHEGMTLRDYFAGQALVGIVSNHIDHETMSAKVANICYRYADAMMEARK